MQSACPGSSRNSVSGRPRRLLWLRWVASVGTCGAQSAASMSFVDVLPFDPAMPITFPPHARRTCRAMAPSAVERLVGLEHADPVERPRARPCGRARRRRRRPTTSSRKSCPSARSPSSAQNSAPGAGGARVADDALDARRRIAAEQARRPRARPPRAGSSADPEQLPGHAAVVERLDDAADVLALLVALAEDEDEVARPAHPPGRGRSRAGGRARRARRRRARARRRSARRSSRSDSERGLSLVT